MKFTMLIAASRGLLRMVRKCPRTRHNTYALPFFEFTRSATSKLRPKFGSKFCGSQALSEKLVSTQPENRLQISHMYRCSVDCGSPKLPPKRSLEAMRAEAASMPQEGTDQPSWCCAILWLSSGGV